MKPPKQSKREFSELVEKHQGLIHRVTLVYANSPADRDDLFQEICLQLWRSYGGFREESEFATWMYRVALNTAISSIRKKRGRPVFEALHVGDRAAPERPDDQGDFELLHGAIAELSPIDKAVILLWLEEKSYEEIASIMGITKSNVSVRLVRIKKKLRDRINKTIEQEP
jgi:RNA polymerase sigma-70 factor (ECF subfamily)